MSVSGIGQRQRRPDAAGGADGAEQIGVVIALVGGLPGRVPRLGHCRTSPFFWPMRALIPSLTRDVLKTRFRSTSSRAERRDEPSARAGSFFERLDDPLVLSRMARPGAHAGKAELLQKLSDIARVKVDAEPLSDDALEVDPPPPHDAVLLTIRPGLDDLRKLGPLLLRQAGLGARPIVDEAPGPGGVEAMHPVAQRLAVRGARRAPEPPQSPDRANPGSKPQPSIPPSSQQRIRPNSPDPGDVGAGRGGTVRDRARRHRRSVYRVRRARDRRSDGAPAGSAQGRQARPPSRLSPGA